MIQDNIIQDTFLTNEEPDYPLGFHKEYMHHENIILKHFQGQFQLYHEILLNTESFDFRLSKFTAHFFNQNGFANACESCFGSTTVDLLFKDIEKNERPSTEVKINLDLQLMYDTMLLFKKNSSLNQKSSQAELMEDLLVGTVNHFESFNEFLNKSETRSEFFCEVGWEKLYVSFLDFTTKINEAFTKITLDFDSFIFNDHTFLSMIMSPAIFQVKLIEIMTKDRSVLNHLKNSLSTLESSTEKSSVHEILNPLGLTLKVDQNSKFIIREFLILLEEYI